MTITNALPCHAPLIGSAIVMAVGSEICTDFAAPNHTIADVERLFASLATLTDSQYSYLNTLVALDSDGTTVMGVCVAYPGRDLYRLRTRFFEQVKLQLGRDMDAMPDETSPDEFYIDTLAVFPAYRRRGVATALLRAAIERAHSLELPAGLLVDKTNARAQALYASVGFRYRDDRPFAHVLMDHLQA
jgi:DNA-3-methyladenine glycosylase I